jgi:hypothetical protein
MITYKETQGAPIWVYIPLAVALAGGLFSLLLSVYTIGMDDGEGQRIWASFFIPAAVLLIVFPLVVNLLALRTEVQRDQIYVYLGLLFPMMWKRLPLDSIASAEVVQYRPIRDAGGWGYRYGRYNGRACWYYNMRGDRGVLVVTRDNKQHIIGSQQPEALAAAIIAALSARNLAK